MRYAIQFRGFVFGLAVAIAIAMAVRPSPHEPQVGQPRCDAPLGVITNLYGHGSRITDERVMCIQTETEWYRLWHEHITGDRELDLYEHRLGYPKIDFRQMMVVAVFEGEDTASNGCICDSVRDEGSEIVIRVQFLSYQTAVGFTPTPVSHAWGIFVLPRVDKPVMLERDTRESLEHPSQWSPWITFPAHPMPVGRRGAPR